MAAAIRGPARNPVIVHGSAIAATFSARAELAGDALPAKHARQASAAPRQFACGKLIPALPARGTRFKR
jgi:hypothetical protein